MKKALLGFLFLFTLFLVFNVDKVKAYPISSGTYKITSSLDENKVLTSSEDGNIQINTDKGTENQLWDVLLQSDGSYLITSKSDNSKSFDVEGGLSINGTNIRLFNINKTNAQKWILRESNNGFYYVTSKINGSSVIDVLGANVEENTNVQLHQINYTNAQKFKFVEVLEKEPVIDDGTYIINTKLNTSFAIALDNEVIDGSNVSLDLNKSNYIQAWNFKYLSDGYYQITPYSNDDLVLNDTDNNIQIKSKTENNNKWIIKKNYDGTYSLISSFNNYYMDVAGGLAKAGTNVGLFQGNDTNAQKFIFTKVDFTKIESDLYTISAFGNENVFLTLNNKVVFNGTNVELREKSDDNYQKWYIENIEENIYEIKSAIDEKFVFDVSAGSLSSGANIQVWQSNSSGAQRWRIIKLEDGFYRFTNVNSGKNIDVAGAVYANGINIQQFDNNGTNAQKFNLNKTNLSENKKVIFDDNYILYSALNLNKSLNYDYNLYINDVTGSAKEIISIKYIKNGFYVLKNGDKAFTNNSSNVVMANYSGNDNQLWYAEKKDDYYVFISKADGKVLDVVGGSTANKTKLQTFISNGTNAQKFYLEAVQNKKIEEGYYTILSNNDYLSIDSEVPYNGSKAVMKKDENKWYIKNIDGNLYEIRYALNQNKVLDVSGGNVYDGNDVQLFSRNKTDAQRWYIICLKDGSYKFISSKSHTLLTIINDKAKIYSNNKDKNQKFTISVTDSASYGKTIEEGYYTINSSLNNKKVLDVSGGNIAVGTNVQLWTKNDTVAQIWKFKYLDNGLYSITSALNPKRSLTSINGNVQVNKYVGNENQKWYVIGLESGNFSIISANDGLYLDVDCAGTKDGTNIKVYESTNSLAQKFSLNEYRGTKTYKGIDISKWQGNINWKLLATENPHFIIMRVGRGLGDLGKDVKFEEYYSNANNYDIPVGVYIYGFATNLNEAKKEADYVIQWLNKKHLDLPVFYDLEHSGLLYLGKSVLTEIAEQFCGSIISHNYHCGVYANIYWLNNFLDGKKISKKYPIWLAHWTGPNDYATVLNNIDKFKSPYNLSTYKYWQFSSLGKYPGITENTVDLDFGYDIFD